MQEENIAIRLKFLIQKLGITNSVFAEKCGISRATLSQMLTGRNKKISDIIIGQIHCAYPSLSIMWLLFNEGKMWIDSTNSPTGEYLGNVEDLLEAEGKYKSISDCINSDDNQFGQNCLNYSRQNECENPDNRGDVGAYVKNVRENGLNDHINSNQITNPEHVNNNTKNSKSFNKIEISRTKSKKVVQITLYYDDSTFESFYPKDH